MKNQQTNLFPHELISVEDNDQKFSFFPDLAAEKGFFVALLVEIDPEEVFQTVSKSIRAEDPRVLLPKGFNIYLDHNVESRRKIDFSNFREISWSDFNESLLSGDYLEGILIFRGGFIVFLGTDESWIVFRNELHLERTEHFRKLRQLSRLNAKILTLSEEVSHYL